MGFSAEEVAEFFSTLYAIIYKATEEANNTPAKYGGDEERALLIRLASYRNAYFAWVTNFDLPVTSNVSERALRGCKTKMKVSGQFLATESASNYAVIKTYLATCVQNGINEEDALIHLCAGVPYSVGDLFGMGAVNSNDDADIPPKIKEKGVDKKEKLWYNTQAMRKCKQNIAE